jgi:hypothetical protein
MDAALHASICQSISELKEGMDKVSPTHNTNDLEFNQLKEEEVLKEQLRSIKNSISDEGDFDT